MSPGAWRTGATRRVEEWQRHLASVDRAFGNVVERHARDVGLLLANGSAWEAYDDADTLVGVALASPDEECLVRVASDHRARATLMESGIRLVQEHLRRGVPLWVPSKDVTAENVAKSQGMTLSHRDLQMRIDTASARRSFGIVRHLDVTPSARRRGLGAWALNELVARFAEAGQPQAQLGVHDDNESAAPALYVAPGWRVVSSQGKWIQVAV